MTPLPLMCGCLSGPQIIIFLGMYVLGYGLMAAAPVLIIAGIIKMIHSGMQARRDALPANLCPHCHYDLRATPDANGSLLEICPECGQLDAHLLRPT